MAQSGSRSMRTGPTLVAFETMGASLPAFGVGVAIRT